MNDEREHERRPLLRRRRPDPEPGPEVEPEVEPRRERRHVLRTVVDGLGRWVVFAGELPVVLRFLLWGVLALLGALIFRTLRGNPTRKG